MSKLKPSGKRCGHNVDTDRKAMRAALYFSEGVAAYRVKRHLLGCPYRREWLRVAWLRGVYSAASEEDAA